MHDSFNPIEIIDGDYRAGLILLCDHARNALPAEYGDLGLHPREFERHIAYDIGARDVTLGLARALGVPAVLTTFSRLLVDPNRGEDDPTVVMRIADGSIVPGNRAIDQAEIGNRLDRFHRPYHAAVDAAIDRAFAAGTVPALFSVHSFTPAWRTRPRPWQVALLWDSDPRFSQALLELLRADAGLTVGDNEPYDGALKNDTMYRHGTARGLAHILIELRQDLIAQGEGVDEWVGRLAPMLERCNALAALHSVSHFGSRTGAVEPRENPSTGGNG